MQAGGQGFKSPSVHFDTQEQHASFALLLGLVVLIVRCDWKTPQALYMIISYRRVLSLGEETAKARRGSRLISITREIVGGRYLPWFCAVIVVGLLSIRVGVALAIVMALSSCALFAMVLATVGWCASPDQRRFHDPSLPHLSSGTDRSSAILFRPAETRLSRPTSDPQP